MGAHEHLQCARTPDEPRQSLRRAAPWHEADRHFWLSEDCFTNGGKTHVHRKGDSTPSTSGAAFDFGNGYFAHVPEALADQLRQAKTAGRGNIVGRGSVAGVEHRIEDDLKRAIRTRMAAIHTRLEAVRNRVVEDLKRELRRVMLMLALAVGCGVLALVGATFAVMAAWTDLQRLLGALSASLILAAIFLLASMVLFALLQSVRHRALPAPPPNGGSATGAPARTLAQ
jgi:uncharacterized membrane protein YqjE